jgi:hypothetical protein
LTRYDVFQSFIARLKPAAPVSRRRGAATMRARNDNLIGRGKSGNRLRALLRCRNDEICEPGQASKIDFARLVFERGGCARGREGEDVCWITTLKQRMIPKKQPRRTFS